MGIFGWASCSHRARFQRRMQDQLVHTSHSQSYVFSDLTCDSVLFMRQSKAFCRLERVTSIVLQHRDEVDSGEGKFHAAPFLKALQCILGL